jgi:hypothetical protein
LPLKLLARHQPQQHLSQDLGYDRQRLIGIVAGQADETYQSPRNQAPNNRMGAYAEVFLNLRS